MTWSPGAEGESRARPPAGGRLAAMLGGVSGGLGTFGALHNVCHYTCQLVVAGLGVVGITLTGLPLAFLEDPMLIVLFGGMGIGSLGASMTLHGMAKRRAFQAAGLRGLFDRRMAVLLVFLLLSGWSVSRGAARMFGPSEAAESATRTSKEGSVDVELTLPNLKDRSLKDVLVFELAMNSMDMSAPSFETMDLKAAITLQIEEGEAVHPAEVQIPDWGHMGHHARGRLMFPWSAASAPKDSMVRVIIRGIGGVEKRVLEW